MDFSNERYSSMVSAFKEALESGKFVITSEVAPPKGTNLETMKHHVELLSDKVDGMNITDHQSSVMRFPSLGGALLVKEMGGEPILQMTCRDRNRIALQMDILGISALGLNNILCLTGDHQKFGNHPMAKGVYDLDSIQFVRMVKDMRKQLLFFDLTTRKKACFLMIPFGNKLKISNLIISL